MAVRYAERKNDKKTIFTVVVDIGCAACDMSVCKMERAKVAAEMQMKLITGPTVSLSRDAE